MFCFISGVAVVAAMLTGCTFKRYEEFECGLPDGSSFIYRNRYNWDPLAKIIPSKTALSERLGQTGFQTYYKSQVGEVKVSGSMSGLESYNYNKQDVAVWHCQVFGLVNNSPYLLMSNYKSPEAGEFSSLSLGADKNLILNPPKSESLPRHVLDEIERLGLSYGRAAIVWRPERLVIERSLIDKNKTPELITAVYRVESFDGGKAWVNPRVTTKSEAFELGKADEEQCFIARLIRIDNKKIEAHFPPCPVAHKLPD